MAGKVADSKEQEISRLNAKVKLQEDELKKLEQLEKSLAYHELVLAKKVTDMNRFEEKLEKHVNKQMFEELKKDMKKIESHEAVLFENSRYLRELMNELNKMRESNRIAREQTSSKSAHEMKEMEDEINEIKKSILSDPGKKPGKAAEKRELEALRLELHDRISQVEYQNKVLMKYLKIIDDLIVNQGVLGKR